MWHGQQNDHVGDIKESHTAAGISCSGCGLSHIMAGLDGEPTGTVDEERAGGTLRRLARRGMKMAHSGRGRNAPEDNAA